MRFICLIGILLWPKELPAAVAGDTPAIRLISDSKRIGTGGKFHLGLHIDHPAGTHTYWKHPGIVGFATKIEWELPPGFSAGEIEWPAPSMVMMSVYQAQGYEGDTLLIIPVTAPENMTAGSATLAAKVSWMCCGKACTPAMNIPFSLTLPIGAVPEQDLSTRPLFDKFSALVPRRDPEWKTSVTRGSGGIILSIKPPVPISNTEGIRFFTADGQVDSAQKQRVAILPDGTIRSILASSETGPENPATLPGVITIPVGSRIYHLEIEPEY